MIHSGSSRERQENKGKILGQNPQLCPGAAAGAGETGGGGVGETARRKAQPRSSPQGEAPKAAAPGTSFILLLLRRKQETNWVI